MPLKRCQQNTVIKMLHDGHKINFFNQTIYKSFRVFSIEMQELKNADLINMKLIERDGKQIMEYSLSMDGLILAKILDMVNKKLII